MVVVMEDPSGEGRAQEISTGYMIESVGARKFRAKSTSAVLGARTVCRWVIDRADGCKVLRLIHGLERPVRSARMGSCVQIS